MHLHDGQEIPPEVDMKRHFALLLAALVFTSTAARAANRFWITSAGGAFGTPGSGNANWSTTEGGAGGATAPTTTDTAFFSLNNTYDVTFSTAVTNQILSVDRGNVTFDLDGLVYTTTNQIGVVVGTKVGETGRLTLTNGTLAVDTGTADNIHLGTAVDSSGFLTVATGGQIGSAAVRPNIFVGLVGNGTLTVQNDAKVFTNVFILASNPGATATVNLNGPQARIDAVNQTATIGDDGTATMTVSNGADFVSTSSGIIAANSGSTGTLTITGAGSRWAQGLGLTVGGAGVGTLNVQSGGTVTGPGATIGSVAGGFGTATITGNNSTWALIGSATVGSNGEGTLTVSSGGQVSTGSAFTVGSGGTGRGNVTVTGIGSRLDVGSALTVGSSGEGSMTVASGGRVSAGTVVIGSGATASGTLSVESGGELTANSTITVSNTGRLNLDGGTVRAGGLARSGAGAVNWGDGTLSIVGGTYDNGGSALVINGADAGDRPTLRLTGDSNSLVAQVGSLTVGGNRGAALEVTGGSTLQVPSLSIGALDGGDGIVTLSGSESNLSTTGDINVGGTASAGGGVAALNIGPQTSVSTASAGQLRLWAGGTINLNGGILAYGTLAANGGKVNFISGTIQQFTGLSGDDNTLNTLLGPTHELAVGRRLLATGADAILAADLDVNGGHLDGMNIGGGGALTVTRPGPDPVTLRVRGGGVVDFVNGILLENDSRVLVDGGTINAGFGSALSLLGELRLSGAARVSGFALSNSGLIAGSGRVDADLNNFSTGQVRIAPGERMLFTGSPNQNVGLIDVSGGELEFTGGTLINGASAPTPALIAARGATLRFGGGAGLINNGAITFTSGVSDVFGDINNANPPGSTPGRIVVSGGAQANFFDDVTNNGSIQVSAAGPLRSTAVFLGSLSGGGTTGGGNVFLEGDVRPGFSPGIMAFGGDVSLGPVASVSIELGGLTPGTRHDRVDIAGQATLAGTLQVTLIDGFSPAPRDQFTAMTFATRQNRFDHYAGLDIPGPLALAPVYSITDLKLFATLPGDANFDVSVDFNDLAILAQNYNNLDGQRAWGQGDFTYDGNVDFTDLALMAQNYNTSLPAAVPGASDAFDAALASVQVPEPAMSASIVLGATLLLRRRTTR
jgi:T5SS/PEP-CTERM-associated repeat protein